MVIFSCIPFSELETSPEYARMISETERSRSSQGSNDGSLTSQGSSQGIASTSPASPTSQTGVEGDDFVNKVCKFEMISRGKNSTSSKSSTSKSLTVKTTASKSSPQDVKVPSPTSAFGTLPGAFVGEKVFTRDTATTRVSASLLQGLGKDRVQSTVSTNSSNSLTSVSTLSWTSDVSDSFSGSPKGLPSAGAAHSNKLPEVMTTSDPGVFQTKTSSPSASVTSSATFHDFQGGVGTSGSPLTKETYIFTNSPTGNVSKRGGIIDLSTGSTKSTLSATSSNTFPQQQQHQHPSGTTKKFVTLSTSSREYPPTPLVKPLSPTPSGFPFITPNSPANSVTRSPRDSSSPVVINGEASPSSDAHSHDSLIADIDSCRLLNHRNTFEGMDFELNELTPEQRELALKHREVVAERKLEQEREKKDRQRLDEILKMCEEYQHEISEELFSPTQSNTKAPFGFTTSQKQQPQQQHGYNIKRIQSPVSLEMSKENASSPSSSLESRDRVGSMSKIKTNGSLILNSPNNVHKELGHFTFQTGSGSATKAESTMSLTYSSNSEDEAIGSSEDTGTIKKRPHIDENPQSPLKQPHHSKPQLQKHSVGSPKSALSPHITIGHNAITMTADISDDNMIITTTNSFTEAVTVTLPDTSHPDFGSSLAASSPKTPPSASSSFRTPKPQQFNDISNLDQFIKENSPSPVHKTVENGYKKNLHHQQGAEVSSGFNFSIDKNSQFSSSSAAAIEKSQEHSLSSLPSEKIEPTQGWNSSPPNSVLSSKRESKDSSVRESHSSTSSSQTLHNNSNHSSRTSSFSSSAATDAKEDTPTPVNSDSEQGDAGSGRSGQLSLLLSSSGGVSFSARSSAGSLSPKEVCIPQQDVYVLNVHINSAC